MITAEESNRIPHPVQIPYHELQLVGSEVREAVIGAFAPVQGYQGVGCRRGALAKAAATKTPTLWNSAGVFTIAQGR